MEQYLKRYRELINRGICAHAALCHIISFSYMQAKEQGLSLPEADQLSRQVVQTIRREWEDA